MKRCMLALSLLLSIFISTPSSAGLLVVAGDSNIVHPLSDDTPVPANPGNQAFFTNVLGNGTSVLSLDTGKAVQEYANSFYDSLNGVTSSLFTGPISSALLTGADLLFLGVPAVAFTSPEIAAVSAFLGGGGTVFVAAENRLLPDINNTVNALLEGLGSAMRIEPATHDAGFHTVGPPQIVPHALTLGVTSFTYAYTSAVTGGEALMLTSNLTDVFVAAEFSETETSVPVPASLLLLGMGLIGAGALRKRS